MNTQDAKRNKVSSNSQVPVRAGYSLVVVIIIVLGVVVLGIIGANKSFNAAIEAGDRENQTGGGAMIKGFVNDGLDGMYAGMAKGANDDFLRQTVMECETELAVGIIQGGGNVDLRFESGATLLHRAANDGSYEIVVALIEKEANVDAINKKGDTPLHTAARRGWYDIVQLLIDNLADINARNKNRDSVLSVAQRGLETLSKGNNAENQHDIIDLLRSYGAEE